jgi:hypothetical protein
MTFITACAYQNHASEIRTRQPTGNPYVLMVPGFFGVARHVALVYALRHAARGQLKTTHTGELEVDRRR